MAHEFVILVNGELVTYTNYDDIPEQFDNIIKFLPDIPDGPHSHDDHDEISKWNERLQQLMEKERASSNKNRRRGCRTLFGNGQSSGQFKRIRK